ncbi:hypothetical protein BDW02DRAFT_602869 [Decorospora gaudefroyi]|uniref:Uncharacterized protein n=1 Tax=Decorospora gaudefroyi TaxID=184978 RepID=A0A6A5JWP5_9PLEO|nr:hypothetical protein BDW02DRAFT_602869 [Decorospora gaudefroyi]
MHSFAGWDIRIKVGTHEVKPDHNNENFHSVIQQAITERELHGIDPHLPGFILTRIPPEARKEEIAVPENVGDEGFSDDGNWEENEDGELGIEKYEEDEDEEQSEGEEEDVRSETDASKEGA